MPMSRTGLSSLMGYAPGGAVDLADIPDANEVPSIYESYLKTVGDIKESPLNIADVKSKAEEYGELFPQTEPQSFYDLAGALAKGIFKAQAEKFPTLGRGLGYGFEIFNQANDKRRQEKQKLTNALMTMALQSAETNKKRDYELRSKLAEIEFENLIKAQITRGNLFTGKTPFEQALNFIMTNKNDPKIIKSPEYAIMYGIATKPNTQIVQTESGALPVTTPGLDLSGIVPPPDTASSVKIKVGDSFPDPKYSSYILQGDGTFMSNGMSYTWNEKTGMMEPI